MFSWFFVSCSQVSARQQAEIDESLAEAAARRQQAIDARIGVANRLGQARVEASKVLIVFNSTTDASLHMCASIPLLFLEGLGITRTE